MFADKNHIKGCADSQLPRTTRSHSTNTHLRDSHREGGHYLLSGGELEVHVLARQAPVHGREGIQLVLDLLLILLVQVAAEAYVQNMRGKRVD